MRKNALATALVDEHDYEQALWEEEEALAADFEAKTRLNNQSLAQVRKLMSEEVKANDPLSDVSYSYTKVQNLVKYTVVDITNKSSPVVEKEMYIEGNYHTARMVDGTVRSVTHLWTYFDGIRNWVELPQEYWSEEDTDERMGIWN